VATRSKQQRNLEIRGKTHNNSFAVLNNIDDGILIHNAKKLDIVLAPNNEGSKEQISAMKAEERLRVCMAEAAYLAHRESLKHRECVRDDEVLDLTVIDNSRRDFESSKDAQKGQAQKRGRFKNKIK
jgi:hypothetical protein